MKSYRVMADLQAKRDAAIAAKEADRKKKAEELKIKKEAAAEKRVHDMMNPLTIPVPRGGDATSDLHARPSPEGS